MKRIFALAAVVSALACNSPEPKGPPTAANEAGAATPAPSGATTSAACASDADCRTMSSYCADAPCACRVLARKDPEPSCAGTTVNCFADPCMNKTAACQGGTCQLVSGAAK